MSIATTAVPAQEVDSHLHSPPDSNKESPSHKHDASDSELSDIEDPEEDIGVIQPEEYADEGRVPVFKPTMAQFKSFTRYMEGVNPYGMKSGIVKVIPPAEWKDSLPRLDEAIKTIKVKEPIKQDIMGTNGTYRQANILHQRSYNLPQWRQLCEQSEHQPPAKRGERRLNQDKLSVPRPPSKPKGTPAPASGSKRKPGRPFKNKSKSTEAVMEGSATPDRLPTPVSPSLKAEDDYESIKQEVEEDDIPFKGRMGGRQPKAISVSSRRKYNRREASTKVDEAAFKDFKYELGEEFPPERCEELERAYWRTLTYAPPLYGADMPGSLFTDSTTSWNLGKLDNILDAMGSKIPGVNTAYLYLGMWKATFAWHLEDVDLYSINYLHFGAPKQWYSISQGDARRFEAAMKSIWPTDAKACDQFLRHKTFLISPSHLLQNFNIKVNKIVCYPGEFVITFPYGYHSGYNLGYNCAEAVNFGMESWLEYGRVAKKCDCDQAQDSVWIDVRELERKLRGEETEYEIETDDDEEEEDEEDINAPTDLPTPPDSNGDVKVKAPKKKRKRTIKDKGDQVNLKRVRLRLKAPAKEPCILCPNDIPNEPLLPTEDGQQVHRMCALYIPETSIESGEKEIVRDVKYIAKARMDLKCNYCRSKKGACFQCSQKKCIRAYHATCAAAAGVFVETGDISVFGEDGTEYKDLGIEFSCRFHRTKRDKALLANDLSEHERTRKFGFALEIGDTCQLQYYRADIFAGTVVDNRKSEETLLVSILPRGEQIEIEYKWLLIPSPADYKLTPPSANAIPLPKSFKAKESLNTSKRQADDLPRADDAFVEGCTWAEFNHEKIPRNLNQVKVDITKENQIWYYLGKTSTEARAQFTEDPTRPRHNPRGHFLDTIPKPVVTAPRQSYAASYPSNINQNALNASRGGRPSQPSMANKKDEKPYVYKPRIPQSGDTYRVDPQAYRIQQNFLQASAPNTAASLPFGTDPRYGRPNATGQTAGHTLPASGPRPSPTTAYSNYPNYSIPSATPQTPRSQQQQSTQQVQPSTADLQRAQHQQSQSSHLSLRAPLAPPAPYRPNQAPPTAQAPRQNPFKATARVNPFAKYAYLQKEHNRSPQEYKSPYRPGHGFMNGYQGDLQKYLQQSMFKDRQPSVNTLPPSITSYSSGGNKYPSSQPSSQSYPSSPPPDYRSQMSSNVHQQTGLQPQQITKPINQQAWEEKDSPQLHPAIRQEYNANSAYSNHSQPQISPSSQFSAPEPYSPHPQPQYGGQHSQRIHQSPQYSPLTPQAAQFYPPYQPQGHAYSNQSGDRTSVLAPPVQYHQHQIPQHNAFQDPRPVYTHQSYFQKTSSQSIHPEASQQPHAPTQSAPQGQMNGYNQSYDQSHPPTHQSPVQAQPSDTRDYPDVPADSTGLVERMMANLRKVSSVPGAA
ncbi:hypothetical protein B0O99DRAFT_516058 [Bisporella sp. PMI_857]|nr:hypothetical protein B0O99DRAFT_516058 [Bisporella sp. PMI_857]